MNKANHCAVIIAAVSCTFLSGVAVSAQSPSAGVRVLDASESCTLTRRSLDTTQCSGLKLLKDYVGSCLGRDPNDAASYLTPAATKDADDAAMKTALAKLESQCGASQSNSCDFTNEILELEKMVEPVQAQGEHLKKLLQIKLPEYPPLAFSIQTSASDISMTIEDPESYAQWVSSTAGSANSIIGMFTDLPPTIPLFSGVDTSSFKTGYPNIASSLIAGLDFLNGAIVSYKQSGTQNNGGKVSEFLITQGEALANVERLREGLICSVKLSSPEYFKSHDAVVTYEKKMLQQLATDTSCQSASQKTIAEGYQRAITAKMRFLEKDYTWIDGTIIGFERRKGMGNWEKHNLWVETKLNGNESTLLANTDCSNYKRKNR